MMIVGGQRASDPTSATHCINGTSAPEHQTLPIAPLDLAIASSLDDRRRSATYTDVHGAMSDRGVGPVGGVLSWFSTPSREKIGILNPGESDHALVRIPVSVHRPVDEQLQGYCDVRR